MKTTYYSALASKLKAVRLVCKRDGCGGVVEVPVAKLVRFEADLRCPGCGKNSQYEVPDVGRNHLLLLGLALQTAAAHAKESDIEFIIHEESGG